MTQTFYDFMTQFLREKNAMDVVEVGSDPGLELARALAPHCERFYSVNFPEDHQRMQKQYETVGGTVNNIEFVSGNAIQLPNLVRHANVIILQNVLIDGSYGEDTDLMWRYRRGELDCSAQQKEELVAKFRLAEENAYRGFLKVAKPGCIISFYRSGKEEYFTNLFIERLGIIPSQIERIALLNDRSGEVWEAYFINNP